MLEAEMIKQGRHTMTVCNACRYCEGFCPMFPAMENRVTFSGGDLNYLANLCHNCGECLYACQYAPPHEFGINVPRTLAEIRLASYEQYCWPGFLRAAFRRHGLATALAVAAGLIAVLFASALVSNPERLRLTGVDGDFYQVVPHQVMLALFGGAGLFVLCALIVGCMRFLRDTRDMEKKPGVPAEPLEAQMILQALRDAFTLKHLHGTGLDCTEAEEKRTPWRRWFHHMTFYGFLLCFASTSVAALYHAVFGWRAPYDYSSLPVVLGTAGGIGLLIGPAGLAFVRRKRDKALGDPAQAGLDTSFIALLWMTSLTGMLLLVLREGTAMPLLLIVHLGFVMALFVMLPYGKFVHGIYRTAALIKYALEGSRARH